MQASLAEVEKKPEGEDAPKKVDEVDKLMQ